ncbi:hypothetical protein Taro_050252, partial [Colocasia esculenta]|nr:hypothetical protein [Colocasia esculenta]
YIYIILYYISAFVNPSGPRRVWFGIGRRLAFSITGAGRRGRGRRRLHRTRTSLSSPSAAALLSAISSFLLLSLLSFHLSRRLGWGLKLEDAEMGSDAAMANSSGPAISRDGGGKKKRNNRSAKLKQCKLDARREQWLSQLKNKGCEVADEHALPPSMSSLAFTLPLMRKADGPLGGANPEVTRRRDTNGGTSGLHENDMDSPMNSPTSSVSGNNSSGKGFPDSSLSSGSYSRSVSDADEEDEENIGGEGGDDGAQDDWEAVADALTTNDGGQSHQNSEHTVAVPESTSSLESRKGDGILKKPEPDRTIPRAWRADDVFRPQSLPNLSKQRSFPVNLERYCNQRTKVWEHQGTISQSSSCPICFEDLDLTDSSFLPCSCGFRLCLFCHKRILETDGRCPGCRKQYGQVRDGDIGISGGGLPLLPLRLSRSCSMKSRS